MATAVASGAAGWHAGERAIHQTLLGDRERPRDNPTYHGLEPSYGYRVQSSPLVAFGALDRDGRPWTTIWGGEAGFCRPVAQGVLGVRGAAVDARFDPVLGALFGGGTGGEENERGGFRMAPSRTCRWPSRSRRAWETAPST
ncbi:hypothetical protein PG994_006359 [Apiospora phragmitis]|uniref:Uncharacterized protein n=1 Tax=Apiospora phragmitis TaxID=2905665 RepID=A0ABR1VEW9_9PEZI